MAVILLLVMQMSTLQHGRGIEFKLHNQDNYTKVDVHQGDGRWRNLQWTQVYDILPAFGKKYAPGVTRNLEHAFALKLLRRAPVILSEKEHVQFRWAPAAEALATVFSSTNRAVIQHLRH